MSRRPLAKVLSASTADLAATTSRPSPVNAGARRLGRWTLPAGRFYLVLAAVALAVAILSLLIPSTPSYDPWAWIVWGREIVHLNLHTVDGPSWKPLPVIFTTLFAPFGQAEPDMWLVVARAGAFAAVVMVFRLAFRFTREIGSYFTHAEGELDPVSLIAPGLLAGAIAAISLTLSGGYLSDNALGYSEGLATAIILIAIERGRDGHPRQAFALGFVAALDRPEIWLIWGPYGLYLWWKDPGARRLIAVLFLFIPVLWFLPEYWGSGHFLRGVNRAQHPRSNSLAFAHCPFCSELVDAAWPTMLLRLKAAAAVMILGVSFLLWRMWRTPSHGRPLSVQRRAQLAAAGLGLLGVVWFVVIAIMTQAGFSGNNRYLVIGSAMVDICGAVGWGWAAYEVGNLLLRVRPGRAAAVRRTPLSAWAAVALVALVFCFAPNWVGTNYIDVQKTHKALVYQAHLRQDAATIVREGGGAQRLLHCGTVMTEGFQVPMVAWTLGVHTAVVQPSPLNAAEPGPPPNVILQTSAHTNGLPLPIVQAWKGVNYKYVAHVRTFRLFEHCA